MAHYIVTGAAGFIAARVVGLLLDEGHTVTALDNLNDAYDVRIKHWRLAQLEGRQGFTFHTLDITDRPKLETLFASLPPAEAVVNLAARAGVRYSVENPWVYQETNVTGTLNLLDLCRRRDIGKFILASTSSLYGTRNPLPYREDANTDHALSPYAASKKAAEALCHTYHHLYGLDVIVLRYFTVYGPAGRPDMSAFRFTQWIAEGRPVTIYGDGEQSRDFTYVDDIARGTVLALRPSLGYSVFNLGSDRPLKLMRLVRLIEERVGREADLVYQPAHPADMPATWADVTAAREGLGWESQVTFEQGVTHLVDWYMANREWAAEIHTD